MKLIDSLIQTAFFSDPRAHVDSINEIYSFKKQNSDACLWDYLWKPDFVGFKIIDLLDSLLYVLSYLSF